MIPASSKFNLYLSDCLSVAPKNEVLTYSPEPTTQAPVDSE